NRGDGRAVISDPHDEATAPLDESAVPKGPGRLPYERVGPYRLIRPLGAGGMGEVFLAERDDQSFRQEVAIKLFPFVLADSDRAARLRSEERRVGKEFTSKWVLFC